ncbi:MAG: aminoacyl-tRNA hydrolase [Planctomycetaceae bacterium]|nr:aminoacyl-tRNA hydrolase [Planctomycetaceae bacterium]
MVRINHDIEIPDTEFEFTYARSGGPGGQNVNKVNSKAVLRWNPSACASLPPGVLRRFLSRYHNRMTREGDIVLHSQRYRDQGRNTADCIERLREMILAVVAPPVQRKKTRPSRGANRRRLENKKQASEKKQNRRRPRMDD